ncbi:MAG: hypothetical protein EOP47_25435 [Sphingobacteriaceae bacterium]|nr:MAG: hypothetical protein EOP47_25435 [Sphingobacteriaceae bacterium]
MFTKLLIHTEFEILLPVASIEEKLSINTPNGFYMEKINDRKYKFLANLSIGTMIVKGMAVAIDGIKLKADFDYYTENITKVTLKTSLRIELIVVAIMAFVILYAHINNPEELPFGRFLFFP